MQDINTPDRDHQILDVCLKFVLEHYDIHLRAVQKNESTPLFVGVSGIQGCGKTTLVELLAQRLRHAPHHIETVAISVDDLYLPRRQQLNLASENPDNSLVQHRGQPSTHDIALGVSLFSDLWSGNPTKIPAYDKSAYEGLGDRIASEQWRPLNQEGSAKVRIVIFEGWLVGYRSLSQLDLSHRWQAAVMHGGRDPSHGRLAKTTLQEISFVNTSLRRYDAFTEYLDVVIHLDAEKAEYAYKWRLEQETHMKGTKGFGMSSEQIMRFVDGYFPSYELYNENLRQGVFPGSPGRQLRVVISRDRTMQSVHIV